MAKTNKLELANINYGNCCIRVYDSCKDRKSPAALADQLLESVTLTGGIVEGIIVSGDDGVRGKEALKLINRARYTTRLLYENNCCSDRLLRSFMDSADALAEAISNPEPVNAAPEKNTKKAKPAAKPTAKDKEKAEKDKKRKEIYDNYDPDGFDDYYIEPENKGEQKAD